MLWVPGVVNWAIEDDAATAFEDDEATLATIFAIVVAIARNYLLVEYIQLPRLE